MKRLIERGLMFGNLFRVDSPALVRRYNRALKQLIRRETAETEFHLDISGYSPEVGDGFGDHRYLNPEGGNRQFILLSTEQKTAPLLNARLSAERSILRRFIDMNEAQLFGLTARDAVVGEIEDQVFAVTEPARLFDMQALSVVADTTGNHIAEAGKLAQLVDRFRSEPDAWYDDVLIGQMIELAGRTGDVTRHPVELANLRFPVPDFWTADFGGMYVFRSVPHSAAIVHDLRSGMQTLPVKHVLTIDQRNEIARLLEMNGLVEPIVAAKAEDAAAILRQKMDFILLDEAAELGQAPEGADRRALRALTQRLTTLPEAFQGLAAVLRWVESGGPWPRLDSRHPAYFYTLRAAAGPNRDLVNMLLAELTPLDVRQLFITHKELFYRLYQTWPEAKKSWVAEMLAQEYQMDKQGTRRRLFGEEPGMDHDAPARRAVEGPWSRTRKG